VNDPWRYACPRGHRSIRRLNGSPDTVDSAHTDGYRCRTCGEHYDGRPVDLLG